MFDEKSSSQDELRRIHKTILSFLKSYNFTSTSVTFLKELEQNGLKEVDKVTGKTLVLRPCRCSKNAANQTDLEHFQDDFESFNVYGPKAVCIDDTHCIDVCDNEDCIENATEQIIENCECPECCPQSSKHNSNVRINKSNENVNKTTILYTTPQQLEIKNSSKEQTSDEFIKLRSQFSVLQQEHQRLIAVTSELTSALQLNLSGQTKNIHRVLDHCKMIYPDLFVSQVEVESKVVDYEIASNIQKKCCTEQTKTEVVTPLNLNTEEDQRCMSADMIRDILENVLKAVMDKSARISANSSKKSLEVSHEDIQKIVEEALVKAMESPKDQRTSNISPRIEVQPTTPNRNIITEQNKQLKTTSIICRPVSPYRNVEFFELDFIKLKAHLTNAENEKKLRILQALRWRITKTNVTDQRNKTVESYVENDVLNLTKKNSLPEQFFKDCSISYIQEAISRLINTIASLKYGRDYLSSDDRLLKFVLIPAVKDIKQICSPVTKDMLIATLQKLSLRKILRLRMVKEGLLEELVNYLNECYKNLSKYSLEFCSALIMNLSLVSEAKERASKIPKQIVTLLRTFLESGNTFCLPYINGIMFSLFENDHIRSEAKSQNLDELVLHVMKQTTNENMRKQLDYILQSRLIGKADFSEDTNEENDDKQEEVDLLEGELDDGDFLTNLSSGEELLEEYRLQQNNKIPNGKIYTHRKCPPNTSRSYSGEYQQLHRRTSIDTRVYESGSSNGRKPSKLYQKTHRTGKTFKKTQPLVSMCYLENCRKIQEGDTKCNCSKCIPGTSKYSCSCYENMRKEIAEDTAMQGDFIQ